MSDTATPTAQTTEQHPTEPPVPAPATPNPLLGDPAMVGIPNVIAGATGLGLVTVGYVSGPAAGAALPILLSATAVGMLIATIWAAALGQNLTATIYGTILGFYISYVALSLGLTHNWYGIPAEDAAGAVEIYLICWLVTIVLLTATTLRMPSSFTILFGLVDVALALLLVGSLNESTTLNKLGGYVILAFVVVATYLYVHVMSVASGGKGIPLGNPLITS